jgi:hypothetical protein
MEWNDNPRLLQSRILVRVFHAKNVARHSESEQTNNTTGVLIALENWPLNSRHYSQL